MSESSLKEKEEKVIRSFSNLSNWQEKYELIINQGKKLQPLQDREKIDAYLIKGCQSKAWLKASLDENKEKVLFEADSEAVIVRGIIWILLEIYSLQRPLDIIGFRPSFFEKIGMGQHLSSNRANGLFSFVKQMKLYALALRPFAKGRQQST